METFLGWQSTKRRGVEVAEIRGYFWRLWPRKTQEKILIKHLPPQIYITICRHNKCNVVERERERADREREVRSHYSDTES